MKHLLAPALLALGLCLPTIGVVNAQVSQRTYAPENLRSLSYNDQVRVIRLEYSEQSRGRQIPDDQLRFYIDQVNRSNWGFSQVKNDIAISLGHAGGVGPQPPSGSVIRCDSNNDKSQSCTTPWRGGSRLVRQISKSPCTEGRSWSSSQTGVTVWSGCRAEFAAARHVPPPVRPGIGRTIRCESTNGQSRSCQTPWQGTSRLVRQLSSTNCVEGRSWRSQRGQVLVLGGCRGEFASAAQVQPGRPLPGHGYSVTCTSPTTSSSAEGQFRTCAWDLRKGKPKLIQQLSQAPCREGYSWGWANKGGLWVGRGCSARFGVR